MARYVVRYGTVWYGMARYGMVRYDTVWYGMVRCCNVGSGDELRRRSERAARSIEPRVGRGQRVAAAMAAAVVAAVAE